MTDRSASHPTGRLERDVDDRLILDDRANERDSLIAARRRQDFAYLATLALLVLRGDATMAPIGDSSDNSRIWNLMNLLKHDEHKVYLRTSTAVQYPAAEPRELAEALLIELTRDA